ncbi:hypothetical protein evm_009278 [Chilo suppressalis]|nr:hypothetical protein evm_009278 [Chilo suppressalis]
MLKECKKLIYRSPVHAPQNLRQIVYTTHSRMDPSCSHSKCDVYEGTNQVPFNSNAEKKTDSSTNMVDKEINTQGNDRQIIDDIEREDFEEENRIINHCTSMIVEGKSPAPAHFSGNLSVNSSLASSSETISTFSIANDYSLPGCSKGQSCEDSNATIKNMIQSRKPFVEEPKVDFMQKLLNSNTHEKKDFPKGKMYKAEPELETEASACGVESAPGRTSSNASNSSSNSDSTKDFSVPSTSNAEKLLGLSDNSRKSEPGSSKSSTYMQYCEGEEDSDDDVDEESWCTCLSSHEDDDEDDPEPEPERLWRKRRYEPPPPQCAKKFCPDGGRPMQDNSWSRNLNGNMQGTNTVQGPPEIEQWLNRQMIFRNPHHHHHHQPINVPTAGAQAFPMDGIGRLGHDPPRGPSADWRVLTTADAAGTNGLTCLPKHGGTR